MIPCAGICRASTVDDLKISELEEIMRTNFLGMVYMIEAVLPSMLDRKRGQIVGISSMTGVRGIPFEIGLFRKQSRGGGLPGKPSLRAPTPGDRRHDGFSGLCADPLARRDQWLDGSGYVEWESLHTYRRRGEDRESHRARPLLRIFSAGARIKRSPKPPHATPSV